METVGIFLAFSGVSIVGIGIYVATKGGLLLGAIMAFIGLWLVSDGIAFYCKHRDEDKR